MDPRGDKSLIKAIRNCTNWWYRSDVPIKYESPYASESLSNFSPQSPTLKRRRSEEPDDIGEKRQRIESSSDTLANDHLAAIIAQATASVRQQLGQSTTGGLISHEQDEQPVSSVSRTIQNGSAGHGNGFTSDPHLYMRILSLPILESLVRQKTLREADICFLKNNAIADPV